MNANLNTSSDSARLYLRDAVAILPDNRRDLFERLQRSVFLAKKFSLNLELTLDSRIFLKPNFPLLEAIEKATSSFDGAFYHLHGDENSMFGTNSHTRELLAFCKRQADFGHLSGLCVHPDLVEDFSVFETLVSNEFFVGMEVLDETVSSFNTFTSMADLLDQYPYLGIVLDTAHIEGMEPQGEPPLEKYCDYFADRIVEVHFSKRGNYYDAQQMGASFATNHSLQSLGDSEPTQLLQLLKTIDNLNLVIEGVIPAGKYGENCLQDELHCIAGVFK